MRILDNHTLKLGGREFRPLLVGGMGVNISTKALALEAARAGAIGHISDAMSPYICDTTLGTSFQKNKFQKFRIYKDGLDKTHVKWAPEEVYQASKEQVTDAMSAKIGSGGVFINVMEKLTMGSPQKTLRARLQGALDGGIDGVTLSAGLHTNTLKLIEDHPRFRDALFGIIVSSPRALKIFLRSANRVNRLPDYIIVEGPLAGGHLGFGLDWKQYQLQTIVAEVLAQLREEGLDIPVIPAGGVFTGGDALNYIELGASAVQVATRFTISQECGLPAKIKQIYIEAEEKDVEVNMSSPTGYPMRMLKSSPSLRSNMRPNCESLGYILDKNGHCAYHEAWEKAPINGNGRKVPIPEKMCICFHFMRYQCYTCGHNVYRLKDTTEKLPDGSFYLPPAEMIIEDYLTSESGSVRVAKPKALVGEGEELSC